MDQTTMVFKADLRGGHKTEMWYLITQVQTWIGDHCMQTKRFYNLNIPNSYKILTPTLG